MTESSPPEKTGFILIMSRININAASPNLIVTIEKASKVPSNLSYFSQSLK